MSYNAYHLPKALTLLATPFAVTGADGTVLWQKDLVPVSVSRYPAMGQSAPVGHLRVYTCTSHPGVHLYLPEDCTDYQSIFLLADTVLREWKLQRTIPGPEHFFRCLLAGEADEVMIREFLTQHPQKESPAYIAMIFESVSGTPLSAENVSALLPLETADTLIPAQEGRVLLLKGVQSDQTFEDALLFLKAAEETLLEDGALNCRAAIGEIKQNISCLPESVQEARDALNAGKSCYPSRTLFAFRFLILEQLLSDVNSGKAERFSMILPSLSDQKQQEEELLHTVEVLFEKGLNLSDTARQMYIHRNTLVYRLDKLQRQTGLDLRCFEDAVTFKTLLLLQNRLKASDHSSADMNSNA